MSKIIFLEQNFPAHRRFRNPPETASVRRDDKQTDMIESNRNIFWLGYLIRFHFRQTRACRPWWALLFLLGHVLYHKLRSWCGIWPPGCCRLRTARCWSRSRRSCVMNRIRSPAWKLIPAHAYHSEACDLTQQNQPQQKKQKNAWESFQI